MAARRVGVCHRVAEQRQHQRRRRQQQRQHQQTPAASFLAFLPDCFFFPSGSPEFDFFSGFQAQAPGTSQDLAALDQEPRTLQSAERKQEIFLGIGSVSKGVLNCLVPFSALSCLSANYGRATKRGKGPNRTGMSGPRTTDLKYRYQWHGQATIEIFGATGTWDGRERAGCSSSSQEPGASRRAYLKTCHFGLDSRARGSSQVRRVRLAARVARAGNGLGVMLSRGVSLGSSGERGDFLLWTRGIRGAAHWNPGHQ